MVRGALNNKPMTSPHPLVSETYAEARRDNNRRFQRRYAG